MTVFYLSDMSILHNSQTYLMKTSDINWNEKILFILKQIHHNRGNRIRGCCFWVRGATHFYWGLKKFSSWAVCFFINFLFLKKKKRIAFKALLTCAFISWKSMKRYTFLKFLKHNTVFDLQISKSSLFGLKIVNFKKQNLDTSVL